MSDEYASTSGASAAGSPTAKPSIIDRFFRLFSDVRAGEGVQLFLLALNFFLLMAAYYVLKTIRESEILKRGMLGLSGEELKAYALPAQALLLAAIVVPLYSAISARVSRMRLLTITTVFFAVGLAGFFICAGLLELQIGLVYFLWLGIFNVFVIAQFWTFANDIYSEAHGKRLFPVIAIGGSLGAIFGSFIRVWGKGYTSELMLAAGIVLFICLGLYFVVNRWVILASEQAAKVERQPQEDQIDKGGALRLVFRSRYLLLIGLVIMTSNFINTTGGYIIDSELVAEAGQRFSVEGFPDMDAETAKELVSQKRGEFIGEWYGTFYGLVNILSLLMQAFIVSRIFKYFGVRAAMFVLPLVALGGYALILIAPTLAMIRLAKTAENSTDYSLQNTVRHALFLPTSREAKYKAKAAIDTFFFRFGDSLAAILIFLGIHQFYFGAREYAAVCLVAVVIEIALVVALARESRQLEQTGRLADTRDSK